uniref:NADH dehydrogenase [ubiquinone] iron-sulfur protein 8, mitochondrial n=1 Tax=Lygus hesperus TaxID=30085 RepID=A0A0A9XIC4_LYGHE
MSGIKIFNITRGVSSFLRPSVPALSNHVRNKYLYVNDKEDQMDWNSLTERAASAMFWTEIARDGWPSLKKQFRGGAGAVLAIFSLDYQQSCKFISKFLFHYIP